ncbi:MAG: hypothetical protein ABIO88_10375 [Burkholderiaceae bacterium]
MKFISCPDRIVRTFSLLLAALGASASLWAAPPMVADGVYVGTKGMTLYTFDRDVAGSGKSVCSGACTTNWPPYMATEGDAPAGDFSIITRDDGGKQWAVKGKPVYYWAKDMKPGDKMGDGFNKIWQTAKP